MSTQVNDIFLCGSEELLSSVCKGEPFFGEHEGKQYCVLHFPSSDKGAAFDAAVKNKLEADDFDYRSVWFPRGIWFKGREIRTPADFRSTTFTEASFRNTVFRSDALFDKATFRKADFGSAVFYGPAYFKSARLHPGADFDGASFFEETDFSEADFHGRADFSKTTFHRDANFWRCSFTKVRDTDSVNFDQAVFKAHASFWPTTFGPKARFFRASFASASFGGSRFAEQAVFHDATFGVASFVGVRFSKDADFFSARFDGVVYFSRARFERGARFRLATFSGDALFWSAGFAGETDFSSATFKDYVKLSAEHPPAGFEQGSSCDFQHTRFEKSDRVSFHRMTLRPYWFLNVDPRKFEFVDVKWRGSLSQDLIESEIEELHRKEALVRKEARERIEERKKVAEMEEDKFELEELNEEEAAIERVEGGEPETTKTSLHRLLSITCRQLAVNAEENHRYDEASSFRFWSMELRRKEGWKARGLVVGILHALYRYLSGYGEEIGRALGMLVVLLLVFAWLYTQVGFVQPESAPAIEGASQVTDEVGAPLRRRQALAYSLAVMTLQKPDPRPLTVAAKFAVVGQSILGPIQAALFGLAVRRRFMR